MQRHEPSRETLAASARGHAANTKKRPRRRPRAEAACVGTPGWWGMGGKPSQPRFLHSGISRDLVWPSADALSRVAYCGPLRPASRTTQPLSSSVRASVSIASWTVCGDAGGGIKPQRLGTRPKRLVGGTPLNWCGSWLARLTGKPKAIIDAAPACDVPNACP